MKPEEAGFSPTRLHRMGERLRAEVESGGMPGAVVAIARKGAVVHVDALGYRDKAAGVAMSEDTLFWAASMTKPMTVVGALMLLEEGRIAIDDPIAEYLPELRDRKVARDAGAVPAAKQPTILDLMMHTSGIIEGILGTTPVHAMYREAVGDGMTAYTSAEFLARLAPLPLLHEPGTVWHYGWGIDLLGFVIERVSGQRLGDYLRERLFEPLGMRDTHFGVPAGEMPRYAKALPGAEGALPDLSRAGFDSGGGGVVATARDYLQFAMMLEGRGALGDVRILGRKTVEHMLSDQLGPEVDGSRIAALGSPLGGYGFGLGVAVRRTSGIAMAMGSAGDITWPGVSGAYFWVDPRERLAVVFMAHTPGRARYYNRRIRALVLQALVD